MRVFAPMTYRGFGGLGQCDPTQADYDPATCADVGGTDLGAGAGVIPVTGSVTSGLTDAQIQAAAEAAQANTSLGTNLNTYVTNSSSLPSGTAQVLTAAGIATAAAAKGITAASGPWVVPGTSLVYNPATGQILNAAGALVGSAALPGASIAGYIPLAIGVVAVLFLVSSLRGK
jgi:hypothetical protein